MDKTLQDLAWASLPKEVRSHIKAEYRSGLDNPRMDKCDSVYLTAFENTFGRHNLTSDIEPEEVLMVERKKVQEMRSYNLGVLKYDPTHKGAILLEQSLKRLFGNKCLPDELEQTLEQTSVKVEDSSIQVEDKPRFKVGDKVRISENPSYPHNKPSWVPDMDNFKGKVAILKGRDINGDWLIEESIYSFSERWFEPYTEEKGKQYGKTGKNSKFPYQEKNDMEEVKDYPPYLDYPREAQKQERLVVALTDDELDRIIADLTRIRDNRREANRELAEVLTKLQRKEGEK